MLGPSLKIAAFLQTRIYSPLEVHTSKQVHPVFHTLTEVFSKEWSKTATFRRSSTARSQLPESQRSTPAESAESIAPGRITEDDAVETPAPTASTSSETTPGSEPYLNEQQTYKHASGHSDDGRTIIDVGEADFDCMHNLLYFVYTGLANLHYDSQNMQFPDGYPDEVDALELCRLSDMYKVQPLVDRCLQYLGQTSTPQNISERLFDILCEPYPELRKEYVEYLLANFETVRETKGWRDVIFDTREKTDIEKKYRSKLLLEITRKLTFVKAT